MAVPQAARDEVRNNMLQAEEPQDDGGAAAALSPQHNTAAAGWRLKLADGLIARKKGGLPPTFRLQPGGHTLGRAMPIPGGPAHTHLSGGERGGSLSRLHVRIDCEAHGSIEPTLTNLTKTGGPVEVDGQRIPFEGSVVLHPGALIALCGEFQYVLAKRRAAAGAGTSPGGAGVSTTASPAASPAASLAASPAPQGSHGTTPALAPAQADTQEDPHGEVQAASVVPLTPGCIGWIFGGATHAAPPVAAPVVQLLDCQLFTSETGEVRGRAQISDGMHQGPAILTQGPTAQLPSGLLANHLCIRMTGYSLSSLDTEPFVAITGVELIPREHLAMIGSPTPWQATSGPAAALGRVGQPTRAMPASSPSLGSSPAGRGTHRSLPPSPLSKVAAAGPPATASVDSAPAAPAAAATYSKGDVVEVDFGAEGWFPGRVLRASPSGHAFVYVVNFEDGEIHNDVCEAEMRALAAPPESQPKASAKRKAASQAPTQRRSERAVAAAEPPVNTTLRAAALSAGGASSASASTVPAVKQEASDKSNPEKPKQYDGSANGRRVSVAFDDPPTWYEGVIKQFSEMLQQHYVVFTDGDTLWCSLGVEEAAGNLCFIEAETTDEATANPDPPKRGRAAPAAPDVSRSLQAPKRQQAGAEAGRPQRRARVEQEEAAAMDTAPAAPEGTEYVARENETPRTIAKSLSISLLELLRYNQVAWPA